MSNSDTWPSHTALGSLNSMDSAESCDSVISMNSNYSEDSMEHLSPEERACLMYLQDTIKALEEQDDSGLSTEEPDIGFADEIEQLKVTDAIVLTSDESGKDHKSLLGDDFPKSPYDPAEEPVEEPPATAPIIENNTETLSVNHTSEPEPTPASVEGLDTVDLGAEAPTSTEGLGDSVASGAGNAAEATLPAPEAKVLSSASPIPPPSDFRDGPNSPPRPEKVKFLPPSVGTTSSKPGVTVDLEQLRQRAIAPTINLEKLRQRAATRKTSLVPSLNEDNPIKPPFDMPAILSPPALALGPPVNSSPPLSPLSESPEPKTPPAVAPKPKILPASILLRAHRAAAASSDGNSGHSAPAGTNRSYLDHHKVRTEALRKLGLLRSEDEDSSANTSPKFSPKTRKSWAAPSPQISLASLNTPPQALPYGRVHSQPLASACPRPVSPAALLLSATSGAPRPPSPEILPAPAAFSDCTDSLPSDGELSPSADVSDAVFTHQPLTSSALIKSATLDRSRLGLSTSMAGQTLGGSDFGQLRNSRPRPASLGSTTELSSPRGDDAEAEEEKDDDGSEPDTWTSLPAPSSPSDANNSQKLPRSHGVSVMISPRTENEEDRRVALRKLGLLRD